MKKLVKRVVPIGFFKAIVPFWHLLNAVFCQVKGGFPAKHMTVIGVTGTDGKTTTSTLVTHMLRSSGAKVAMMSTISIDYGDGQGPQPNPTRLTTFSAKDLVKTLKRMQAEGVEYLVLEVTSHALHQHRVWGVPISVAVMTNIGHEHLDYHGTFENYRDAKRTLFRLASKNKKGLRTGIINAEDPSADLFISDTANPITYGREDGATIQAKNVKMSPQGSRYTAVYTPNPDVKSDKKLQITCNLPGSFNVYNSLAAVGVGLALGIDAGKIEKGIESLRQVEGRMVRVDEGQNFDVIIDFAHTPESFDKIFAELKPLVGKSRAVGLDAMQGDGEEAQQDVHKGTLREHRSQSTQQSTKSVDRVSSSARKQVNVTSSSGRMICVFGSAGRRDEAKRSKQGEIAGKWCDIVIATEEDDRDIDGELIMRQIVEGAEKAGKTLNKDVLMVHKREEAIQMAINAAKPGDMVVLLGKGHEKSILYNGPQAAELRHLPQDDGDERRVLERPYKEEPVARKELQQRQNREVRKENRGQVTKGR